MAGDSPPRWRSRHRRQQAAARSRAAADAPPADYDQRSLEIYEFKRVATSGAERGKEIYYYKCWFCHNDFAEGAPKLVGVYQRGTLVTGRPATDDGIKEQIREGSAGMASYKYTLSETDIDDLVTFIREGAAGRTTSRRSIPVMWRSDAMTDKDDRPTTRR